MEDQKDFVSENPKFTEEDMQEIGEKMDPADLAKLMALSEKLGAVRYDITGTKACKNRNKRRYKTRK